MPKIAAVPAKKWRNAGCRLSSDSFCSSSIAKAMNSSQTEPADNLRSASPYFLAGTTAKADLFDLDGTLLKVNSSFSFGKYLYQNGFFSLFCFLQLAAISVLHKMGFIPIESVHHTVFKKIFLGRCSKQVEQFAERFVESHFASMLYSPAVECLKKAQAENHFVAILSSSPDFIVKKFAQKFDVWHVESSIYAVDSNGLFSHIEHLVEGEVKAAWVAKTVEEGLITSDGTTGYTDSNIDLPFLLSCGIKVVVNPNRRLREIGFKNHWEII